MTDATATILPAAAWIERRLLLNLLLPDDMTPTDAIAVVGRALSDASVEIAERDEIIGRRDRDLAAARATNGVMEVSLREAIADLNATREKLTAAVADRDTTARELESFVSESEKVVAALGAGEDDSLPDVAARIVAERDAAAAEAATLRDRVRELEARPVLTVERLAEALVAASNMGEARSRLTAADMMERLCPVTLPAQDRAEELGRTIQSRSVEDGNHMRPWDAMTDAWRAEQTEVVRWALASLGAPATTPSVPADVFAAVSIKDLRDVYYARWAECSGGHRASEEAGLAAVLDALRVKLVAPVDPEATIRAILSIFDGKVRGPLGWSNYTSSERDALADSTRATLDAAGIPVTPEAGKAGSP